MFDICISKLPLKIMKKKRNDFVANPIDKAIFTQLCIKFYYIFVKKYCYYITFCLISFYMAVSELNHEKLRY